MSGTLASTTFSANTGGILTLSNATASIPAGNITANGGSTVQYGNSKVTGESLLGNGTHVILSSGTTTFTNVTTDIPTSVTQNGAATLSGFINNGSFTNTANGLNWSGTNSSTGIFMVNAGATVQNWFNNGAFTINSGGTLTNIGAAHLVSGSGSQITINSGGTLTLQGATALDLNGTALDNNGTINGQTNIYAGSTAIGSGTFGSLAVSSGGTYHPGNSPGGATVNGTFTLGAGGITDFEIGNAASGPGLGWDETQVTGSNGFLAITSGSAVGSQFTIDIITGSVENPGLALNFDNTQNYQWQIFGASQGITGYNVLNFNLDYSGFLNSLGGGSFALSQQGNNVYVDFKPVPEPSTWCVVLLGLLGVGFLRRCRGGR